MPEMRELSRSEVQGSAAGWSLAWDQNPVLPTLECGVLLTPTWEESAGLASGNGSAGFPSIRVKAPGSPTKICAQRSSCAPAGTARGTQA